MQVGNTLTLTLTIKAPHRLSQAEPHKAQAELSPKVLGSARA